MRPWLHACSHIGRVASPSTARMHLANTAAACWRRCCTGDGQLWMMGRLMDMHHGEGLNRRFKQELYTVDDVNWKWAGFGGSAFAPVEGLAGVKDVALGGWHALALVE